MGSGRPVHALLGHLVRKGVFEEPSPGVFALNAAARDLLDPIVRLSLDLDSLGGRMAHAWGTLLEYTRTGEPAYAQRFGLPFFEDLAAHPRIAADFDTLIGPAGHGKHRTISKFTELARRAGLRVVAAGQQPDYFVVECRPY